MSQNNFGCCIDFESGEGTTLIYSLEELQKRGIGPIDTLPFSIRILLEQALRNVDESKSTPEDVNLLANWNASENSSEEIPYRPARVILQDFTGVPAVVDLAAMRDTIVKLGGQPDDINPACPVDLVIDIMKLVMEKILTALDNLL